MIMCFFNAYIKIKILIISGSPRPRENTKIALDEMVKIFDQEDIESEIEHVGNKDIRGCIACISCKARLGHCVFDDCVNAMIKSLKRQMDLSLEHLIIMALPMRS